MAKGYKENSITLSGAVAMGTGVMIGAGIFALTGQIAELAGPFFPLSFVAGAIVTAFSAYTYIKMSNAFPSAGGIGMILKKAYGPTTVAAGAALLMALSMVIAESLVARTFGTYTLRAFGGDPESVLVPIIGVGLIIVAYLINISGSRSVGLLSIIMAVIKVGGIALFGVAGLWASGFNFEATSGDTGATGFVASVALSILAFKGFTTITNSGAEITEPHRNVGRAIVLSIAICVIWRSGSAKASTARMIRRRRKQSRHGIPNSSWKRRARVRSVMPTSAAIAPKAKGSASCASVICNAVRTGSD